MQEAMSLLHTALEFEDDTGLAARGAAPSEQQPKDERPAEHKEAGTRGQERHGAALGGGGCGALLDVLRGRRALQDLFEILQVLLHHQLGVGDDPGGNLTGLAARRVPVVHLDLDAGALWRQLLEAHLARCLYVTVLGIPPYRLVGLVLGRLSIELELGSQRALDYPVGRIRTGRLDLLDVGHELRQVLQGLPVIVNFLGRSHHLYASFDSLWHLSSCAGCKYPSGLLTPLGHG